MTSSTTMYSVGNEVDLSVLLWERLDTRLESDSINVINFALLFCSNNLLPIYWLIKAVYPYLFLKNNMVGEIMTRLSPGNTVAYI